MVRHSMHPDRSFCLGLSANNQVFCIFSEQMLRSVYCRVHALSLVPDSTLPWGFTVSVLGQDEGYTVKYNPLPEVTLEGKGL